MDEHYIRYADTETMHRYYTCIIVMHCVLNLTSVGMYVYAQ